MKDLVSSADAVILVYDVKSLSSFKSLQIHLEMIESCASERLIKVIFGHKNDSL